MENDLRTAILIDGSKDPPAIRIKESERANFVSQGRAGNTPRNFKFVRTIKDESERVGDVYLYRLVGLQMSNEEFDSVALAEADKFLHPERYKTKGLKPDVALAELEEYRRRYGPLKKEA